MQVSTIPAKIVEIRGQRVMLDFELAKLYGVQTKIFKQSIRRNLKRFPPDFMFLLTTEEFQHLRSQIVTSSWGGHRYLPYAFTEQGVAMLSSILNSDEAIEMNIMIVRTFVMMRQYALSYKKIQDKIMKLEKKYNRDFKEIFKALEYLLKERSSDEIFNNRQRIGFKQ
jgi:hypothetical protein